MKKRLNPDEMTPDRTLRKRAVPPMPQSKLKAKAYGAIDSNLLGQMSGEQSDLDLDYEQDRAEVEQKIYKLEEDAKAVIQFEGGARENDPSSGNNSISCDAGGTGNTRASPSKGGKGSN